MMDIYCLREEKFICCCETTEEDESEKTNMWMVARKNAG
jgi:hypothetical protein